MQAFVKSLALAIAFTALLQLPEAVMAQQQEPAANTADAKPTDGNAVPTEISIGNIMPYTGVLAAFGSIGRTESAYFDMVNEQGGINGHKIKFISYDSTSDAVTSFKLTHRLVDEDKVLLLFGSFALPGDLALRPYLNQRRIPDLFVASGDRGWSDPHRYPWSMGWQPPFRAEGRIYANYIQASYPEGKIAVIWQNDQFGRDLFMGLQEGLGDLAHMIVSDITFDGSDRSINSQVDLMRSSGADILIFDGAPAMAAMAIRHMIEIDWHPVFMLDNASASIANTLRPAGLQNSIGVISTAFLKDADDPAWKDDPAMKQWSSFMDKYYPDGDRDDSNTVFGYAAAETLMQVLRQCGGDFSRENIMRQAEALKNYQSSLSLPGITASTGPEDFRPIKQMRLVQFDGNTWQPIGEVIESAFLGNDQ
jgi:branched-chain amino acid transport system substrate-binding protein